ncbi:Uncharacterized protein APZ42_021789 [Daphnia magna]|uniref:Uncharacterized protein n=1 Tax=Daphnia magna TaxID=35525 RepID=A0A0P5SI64_9CRUS|nr:Uncharacterized protein APZ42_021789 [Daphnia magna]
MFNLSSGPLFGHSKSSICKIFSCRLVFPSFSRAVQTCKIIMRAIQHGVAKQVQTCDIHKHSAIEMCEREYRCKRRPF